MIVGVAQVTQREDDPSLAREPLDLMADAIRNAANDTGSARVLQAVDSLRVVKGMWGYSNPARALAQRFDLSGIETGLTSLGGNYVQSLATRSFLDIQEAKNQLIVLTGGECGRTQAKAQKADLELHWNPADSVPGRDPTTSDDVDDHPDLFLGSRQSTRHDAELRRGIRYPIQYYPIFETAVRYSNGETVPAHLERIAELWARFSDVAVENPDAWIRRRFSAPEIANPSSFNRLISHPYPKLMNSNNHVDQGAALIITSTDYAKQLGIPEERWVYPFAATEAWDHLCVSERDNLHSSPAIRLAASSLFAQAGLGVEDLEYVDLYSCFPSVVQVAAREIGLDLQRPLTVTGGLTFAGGPWNNYVMHAVARTVDLLRTHSSGRALVTANGGLLTKHALCIYSGTPPDRPFSYNNLQSEVDATFRRIVKTEHNGEATIEAYTVMYEVGRAQIAHVACLVDEGERTWANVTDPETLLAMTQEEFCGRTGTIDGKGNLTALN